MHHIAPSRQNLIYILVICITHLASISPDAPAQTAPITFSGLNTQISGPTQVDSQTQYNITGGTRPGEGANLFHSFGNFNVPSNNVANFLNDSGLPTENILGRVTSMNTSNIFGSINTTDFGSANLFLMNPAGFLFGPNATVNVGGMVVFTTADYLRLDDGKRFNSVPNLTTDTLLTASPVAAFGFLPSNHGAIIVTGSQLTVAEGTGISLVGGDVLIQAETLDDGTVRSATLSAQGGQIHLASVASTGEVLSSNLQPTPGMSFGAITMKNGAVVDASGPSGGKISIRAGQFLMDNSTLQSNSIGTFSTTAIGKTITVNATQVGLNAAKINTSTSGTVNAGDIRIEATDQINFTDRSIVSSASENLFSNAQGHGGTITLHSPRINISGRALISSSTTGPGNAGDVVIQTQRLNMFGAEEQGGRIITNTQGPGSGGDITVRGLAGQESATEFVRLTNASQLLAQTIGGLTGEEGDAGNIRIQTARLLLDKSSQLSTASQDSAGVAGTITLHATENIHLDGGSSITSNSAGASFGKAGTITLTAPKMTLEGESVISTSTESMENAGSILAKAENITISNGSTITAASTHSGNAGSITIQGMHTLANSLLIDGAGSGIFTETQGEGLGGTITLKANQLQLNSGARITANSAGVADAGNINITATDGLTMQNSSITTLVHPSNNGSNAGGGNIKITTSPAATVYLHDSSTISASVADGPGGGGNVTIDPQYVILQGSQILAQADQGTGGNITIIANVFQPDATSIVNADAGRGVNGTVTIQSPNAPASGKIQPLGNRPLQTTALLTQRCAAVTGGKFSSFMVTGRDSLPMEPGGWLSSPPVLAMLSEHKEESRIERLEGHLGPSQRNNQHVLSLRRIVPPGFLSQIFAKESPAGCVS